MHTGLGIKLIVVAGAMNQIDTMLWERGMRPVFVGGYRVTDKETLKITIEAAGQVRTTCEQFLSRVSITFMQAHDCMHLWCHDMHGLLATV